MKQNKITKVLLITFLIVIIFLLIRTCSDYNRNPNRIINESSYYIPQDATLLLSINTPKVFDELDFESLRKSAKYKAKLEGAYQTNPPFTMVFLDPINAGVDIDKKITFYLDVGTKDSETYTATILNIRDSKKFSNMVVKTKRGTVIKETLFNYSVIDHSSSVAWNDNVAIFLSHNSGFNKEKLFDKIFNPSRTKYFDDNPDYLSFISSNDNEMAFWADFSSYTRNQIHATGKPGEFNKALLNDNKVYGNINFDKGTIDSEIFFDFNIVLTKLFEGAFSTEHDRGITNYLPKGNPSFIADLSLDIDGFFNLLLQDVELKLEARNSLVEYGLMLEDFGKALTGDMLFAGFPNDTTSKSSVLFGMKIKDKPVLFNLLNVMEDVGQIESISNGFYKMNKGVVPFYPLLATYQDKLQRMIIKDDYLFVSLDSNVISFITSLENGNNDSSKFLLPLKNKNNYISFYANRNFETLSDYSNEYSVKDFALNYNGKQLDIHINLMDEKKSSLRQILSF